MTTKRLGPVLALALALACTEKGRSVVLVEIGADTSLTTLATVRAVVAQGGVSLAQADGAWGAPLVKLGVYLSKSVSGSVQVIACGFDAAGNGIATASGLTATISPGDSTGPLSFDLTAGTPAALCGTSSGAGGAGGTAAGTGGGSGGGGGTVGSGGSTAGTGGAAGMSMGGSSGTGGQSGAGGKAGTGGQLGTGGQAGKGGQSGTGGVAGAGGSGTGGSGTGGTAGAGGALPGHSWQGAVGVSGTATSVYAQLPGVAVAPNGDAVVAFEYGGDIWFNHYTAANNSWDKAAALDARGALAYAPKVAVDKNGIFVVVWGIPNDAKLTGIWQVSSSDGVSWSTISPITTTSAFDPALSMNANGDAVCAWTESVVNGIYNAAASIRNPADGTWSKPQTMLVADDDGDRNTAAAMSGTGQAFVGWEEDNGSISDTYDAWMNEYANGKWGTPFMLSDGLQAAGSVSIAANPSGAAIATYVEEHGTSIITLQLLSRSYAPATGFAAALEVGEGNDISSVNRPPSVTLDPSGIATAAWGVQVGSTYEVHANLLRPTDTGWPAETAIETDDIAADNDPNYPGLGQETLPSVASDPAGNVTLIWRKRTSGTRFDLYTRRYPAGGTWNPPVELATNATASVFWPVLAVGADGSAVAAWEYDDLTGGSTPSTVWANAYH